MAYYRKESVLSQECIDLSDRLSVLLAGSSAEFSAPIQEILTKMESDEEPQIYEDRTGTEIQLSVSWSAFEAIEPDQRPAIAQRAFEKVFPGETRRVNYYCGTLAEFKGWLEHQERQAALMNSIRNLQIVPISLGEAIQQEEQRPQETSKKPLLNSGFGLFTKPIEA